MCACEEDRRSCRELPGFLIPSDVATIAAELVRQGRIERPEDVERFLRSAPGAVAKDSTRNRIFQIGTITPASNYRGRCVFLTEAEQCSIHAVAPFGCAYFDVHMPAETSVPRVNWGMRQGADDAGYQALRARLPLIEHRHVGRLTGAGRR